MCGANGAKTFMYPSLNSFGTPPTSTNAFVRIMSWDTAVLNDSDSMSSDTFFTVLWYSVSRLGVTEGRDEPLNSFQALSKKRRTPSIPFISHGTGWPNG